MDTFTEILLVILHMRSRCVPGPFPRGRGLGTRLGGGKKGWWYSSHYGKVQYMHTYIISTMYTCTMYMHIHVFEREVQQGTHSTCISPCHHPLYHLEVSSCE